MLFRTVKELVELAEKENKKISSTRIRACLRDGKLEEVERLLGRPYVTVGEVIHGDNKEELAAYGTVIVREEV